jgi:hypothetical protein
MKTYTHKPLIGMWTLLDQNNTGIFYHYDPFGRLETIKNDWGHILKHYEYAYIKP